MECSQPDSAEIVLRTSAEPSTSAIRIFQRTYPVQTGDIDERYVLQIKGQEIDRLTTSTIAGQLIELYEWKRGGVYFQVVNLESSNIPDQIVEDLVYSLVQEAD